MKGIVVNNKDAAPQKIINSDTLALVKGKEITKHILIHSDTLIFKEYNDDGDYFLLSMYKNDETITFINNNYEDRSLLIGDWIEVNWKPDTIAMAGDDEVKKIVKSIVNSKKIKDGNVSTFRKGYTKKLNYTINEETDYSQSFLDQIYLIVEYYIANTDNEMIKIGVKKNEPLEYSIEKRTRNKIEYIVIGIASNFENKVNTLQWLYYSTNEIEKLYEYDLANDDLVEFKYNFLQN